MRNFPANRCPKTPRSEAGAKHIGASDNRYVSQSPYFKWR